MKKVWEWSLPLKRRGTMTFVKGIFIDKKIDKWDLK
jgi:hypothetical protein